MDFIIDVIHENGEVILESEDKNLLSLSKISIKGRDYAVSNVTEEWDDFYGITRYSIWVYK